ncbi:hypothetical protein Pint_18084 [Pistacia integerrima]|uniref:Uncharacterized protein n=1 Tax=Pistacia integerrima TaxID=434235 RepID=A0ACC0YX37_9ROSI|nr:hypothetical protein Pint_18084 [Pistacia integerrima]
MRSCCYYLSILFNYSCHLLPIRYKAGAFDPRSKFVTDAKTTILQLQRTKLRIKKVFDKIDLSLSSYDTAWVAMVPSPDSPQAPCFPQCINWLLDNQLHDGSWGLPQCPSWLVKDALSCTLACVLALKRWGIGEEQMNKDLNLYLPLRTTEIDAMLHTRHSEFRRSYLEGRKEYLAYVSEGMGKLQDWEMVMKMPVAFHYLCSVLEKFGDAEYHYPTNRCWVQGEEDILLHPVTCPLAFHLLRVNGYDVSSDPLTKFSEEDQFFNSLGGYLKDTSAELSSVSIHSERFGRNVSKQVEYALKFTYHSQLERLTHRTNIEHYSVDDTRILKTSYRPLNIGNQYFQQLAVNDFNICQSIYREELKQLERWVVENKLDRLKFVRQKMAYSYFSGVATLFSPELSETRLYWAKSIVLTTVVDDFFDVGSSIEELVNLVQLVEKWNVGEGINCCSEEVEIIYSAVYNTIGEIAEKAFSRQGHDVTIHLTEIFSATAYVLGPKIPEEFVRHPEFDNLYKPMSICRRLLNAIQTFERESKEGKLNAVTTQYWAASTVFDDFFDIGGSIEELGNLVELFEKYLQCVFLLLVQKLGGGKKRVLGICFRRNGEMVMKYQRKNGSLFNSPSTTAAALTHLHYLRSI